MQQPLPQELQFLLEDTCGSETGKVVSHILFTGSKPLGLLLKDAVKKSAEDKKLVAPSQPYYKKQSVGFYCAFGISRGGNLRFWGRCHGQGKFGTQPTFSTNTPSSQKSWLHQDGWRKPLSILQYMESINNGLVSSSNYIRIIQNRLFFQFTMLVLSDLMTSSSIWGRTGPCLKGIIGLVPLKREDRVVTPGCFFCPETLWRLFPVLDLKKVKYYVQYIKFQMVSILLSPLVTEGVSGFLSLLDAYLRILVLQDSQDLQSQEITSNFVSCPSAFLQSKESSQRPWVPLMGNRHAFGILDFPYLNNLWFFIL